jgi:crossover junction endonuclease MUS81
MESELQSDLETSQTVILTIDVREHDIIEQCNKKGIVFQTSSLEVGDILMTKKVGENTEALIFERKTIADLDASINDGRYREQKQRLKSAYPFHRITYIIEGNAKSIQTSKKMTSALISSRYRDGFHVIHTLNVEDTIWYLTQIRERMTTPDKTTFDSSHGEYALSLKAKTKKSANLTKELVYTMQLSQVPGISVKIAQDISKVYPSMSLLLKAIEEKGVKTFDEVPGMGKLKSKKMIEYM